MAKGDRPVPVDVKCDDLQEPTLVQRVEPNYPAHIRRQGWEGEVELKGIIGTDGEVSDLSVLKSPGKPLSDLAVAAVASGYTSRLIARTSKSPYASPSPSRRRSG